MLLPNSLNDPQAWDGSLCMMCNPVNFTAAARNSHTGSMLIAGHANIVVAFIAIAPPVAAADVASRIMCCSSRGESSLDDGGLMVLSPDGAH